jgi:GNAT superfamily N-acetyltransferase
MTMPQTMLNQETVQSAIEWVCSAATKEQDKWFYQPATRQQILQASSRSSNETVLYGFSTFIKPLTQSLTESPVEALTTFHFAYSTWDGRILFVDQLGRCDGSDYAKVEDPQMSAILRLILTRIATRLECARMTWHHRCPPSIYPSFLKPNTMDKEVLTLHWNADSMEDFVGSEESSRIVRHCANTPSTEDIIRQTLASGEDFGPLQVCLAQKADVDDISRLVQGLADYVNESESVNIGFDQYRLDGFDAHPALFQCLLLSCRNEQADNLTQTCGYAFCYLGETLCQGRFLYLEDLYIDPNFRGKGGGKLLMRTLASLALALGCEQSVWQALDWNIAALNFYKGLGAQVQAGLRTSKFSASLLHRLAAIPLEEACVLSMKA